MTVDFALTHFYRLAVDDFILMYDAFTLYRKFKPQDRSVQEFSDLLANLMEVEAANFESVDEAKLSRGEDGSVSFIVYDYFTSVIFKYLLDDLSQYPFWASKVALATTNTAFGLPVIKEFFLLLQKKFTSGNVRELLEGSAPYLIAGFICNFPHLVKSTHNFVVTLLSKMPRPPSIPIDLSKLEFHSLSTLAGSHNTAKTDAAPETNKKPLAVMNTGAPKTLGNTNNANNKAAKKAGNEVDPYQNMLNNVIVSTLSHPFIVISVNMIKYPMYRGRSWIYTYVRLVAENGFPGLYRGLKSRLAFNILPISPFYFWGIADSIVYRRILGQGSFDSTGGVLSVAREITASEHSNSSALTLLNYGLLTAVHAIPGFLCFVGIRLCARFVFGASVHRKHQIHRRNEIVEAHLIKLKKRKSNNQLQP